MIAGQSTDNKPLPFHHHEMWIRMLKKHNFSFAFALDFETGYLQRDVFYNLVHNTAQIIVININTFIVVLQYFASAWDLLWNIQTVPCVLHRSLSESNIKRE